MTSLPTASFAAPATAAPVLAARAAKPSPSGGSRVAALHALKSAQASTATTQDAAPADPETTFLAIVRDLNRAASTSDPGLPPTPAKPVQAIAATNRDTNSTLTNSPLRVTGDEVNALGTDAEAAPISATLRPIPKVEDARTHHSGIPEPGLTAKKEPARQDDATPPVPVQAPVAPPHRPTIQLALNLSPSTEATATPETSTAPATDGAAPTPAPAPEHLLHNTAIHLTLRFPENVQSQPTQTSAAESEQPTQTPRVPTTPSATRSSHEAWPSVHATGEEPAEPRTQEQKAEPTARRDSPDSTTEKPERTIVAKQVRETVHPDVPTDHSPTRVEPAPLLQGAPQQPVSPHQTPSAQPVPVDVAQPTVVRHESRPAEPAAAPPAPPPEAKEPAAQPLRSVSLEFAPDGQSDVRLRLSERAGEVHISVHSNDPSVHGKLQEGIHDLIGSLSNAGYDANAWTPGQSHENHQRRRDETPNPRRKDTPGAGAEDFGGLLQKTTREGQ